MFTVDEVLAKQYPRLSSNRFFEYSVKPLLRRLVREDDFAGFTRRYPHLQSIDFVEQILEHFSFSYTVSNRSLENIPATGRVMIIANHPIGSLDGLALLKLVHGIRSDVRIIANDLLMFVEPLRPCLLPVNNMGGRTGKNSLQEIVRSLHNEEAVIVFPAGEVSRLGPKGIRDGKWRKGFLSIATRTKAPILPVHIKGRNSSGFYTASLLCRPLSTVMLIGEMFRQRQHQIAFTVGKIIPHESYRGLQLSPMDKVKLFKKHVYRIGKGRSPVLRTESGIARPERRSDLKKELKRAEMLGSTPDDKKIFLYNSSDTSPLIREIGRLREITFRMVGEGSGSRRDVDRFDYYYNHLVLWDEEDLEIVGAYRFVDSIFAVEKYGLDGLYTNTLFSFDPEKHNFLDHGLELGRSFVQKRYWGKRSLDYLWYGIGVYLAKHPQYRYLFGPVSISNAMPAAARELLIYFYQLYFSPKHNHSCSKNPYRFFTPIHELAQEFCGDNYKHDFKQLKLLLANMGTSVPTLYKQYSQLCKPGGVYFLDFNIDPDFSNCVDGLVVVDLARLKKKKRKRYIEAAGNFACQAPVS